MAGTLVYVFFGTGINTESGDRAIRLWTRDKARADQFAAQIGQQPEVYAPHPAQPVHSDDVAVDEFAADLKAQLAEARAKGRSGWEDPAQVDQLDLAMELRRHLNKGDPLDVAALAMMLHMRGESTKLPPLSQDLVNAIRNAPAGASVIEHGGATIFVSRDGDDGVPTIGITPPCSELQAEVVSIKHLAGEIVLQMRNGAEVPQDLESGMDVDVLYTPAQEPKEPKHG